MRRLTIILIITAAAIAGALIFTAIAPAQAQAANWSYCKTSATGWEIWRNANTVQCNYARALFRHIRRYQRRRGHIPVGHRFAIRMPGWGITEYCITRRVGSGYRIRCRDQDALTAMYDHGIR